MQAAVSGDYFAAGFVEALGEEEVEGLGLVLRGEGILVGQNVKVPTIDPPLTVSTVPVSDPCVRSRPRVVLDLQ